MNASNLNSPKSFAVASGMAVLAMGGAALGSVGSAAAAPAVRAPVHVYAATNDSSTLGGNSIVVFDRQSNGKLTQAGTYATGGSGSGAPAGSGFEQSENGLVLGGRPGADRTSHTKLLFAVNAGSDSISVFQTVDNRLRLVGSPVSSGGTKPTSLTVHDNLLYVLNSGALPLGQGGVDPSITGFRIAPNGTLDPISGSTRSLSGGIDAGAAQVEFDTTGRVVTVTERNATNLDNFLVAENGTLSDAIPTASTGNDPFGFAESRLHPGRVIVAQGNFPPPTEGGASSYTIDTATGAQHTVSGNVANGQSDSCWVVLGNGEHYAFITNFFSNDVSSYSIAGNGTLTLAHAIAGVTDSTTTFGANDEAISSDGRYLYARNFVDGSIATFRIGGGGTLVPLGNVGAVGPGTGFGLAAG